MADGLESRPKKEGEAGSRISVDCEVTVRLRSLEQFAHGKSHGDGAGFIDQRQFDPIVQDMRTISDMNAVASEKRRILAADPPLDFVVVDVSLIALSLARKVRSGAIEAINLGQRRAGQSIMRPERLCANLGQQHMGQELGKIRRVDVRARSQPVRLDLRVPIIMGGVDDRRANFSWAEDWHFTSQPPPAIPLTT